MRKRLYTAGALAVAGILAACADTSTAPLSGESAGRPQFISAGPTAGVVDTGEFEICKHGTSATFEYSVNGGATSTITLADGECAVLANTETLGPGTMTVSTTEGSDPSIVLDSIVATINSIRNPAGVRGAPITGTYSYTGVFNGDRGQLVEFYNSPAPPPPPPPPVGCTYTQGYWKNHTGNWPAGFSPSATFYTSGQTWLQVLNTPPKGGNAYYILGHQFIAATLNQANGAMIPSAVQQTLTAAQAYFTNPNASPPSKNQLTAMATTLDNYNNGLMGTPHCP